jgi:hypothetical protein
VKDLCVPPDPHHTAAKQRLLGRKFNSVQDRFVRDFDVIAKLGVQVQTDVIGFRGCPQESGDKKCLRWLFRIPDYLANEVIHPEWRGPVFSLSLIV